jgi:hypothetical protein
MTDAIDTRIFQNTFENNISEMEKDLELEEDLNVDIDIVDDLDIDDELEETSQDLSSKKIETDIPASDVVMNEERAPAQEPQIKENTQEVGSHFQPNETLSTNEATLMPSENNTNHETEEPEAKTHTEETEETKAEKEEPQPETESKAEKEELQLETNAEKKESKPKPVKVFEHSKGKEPRVSSFGVKRLQSLQDNGKSDSAKPDDKDTPAPGLNELQMDSISTSTPHEATKVSNDNNQSREQSVHSNQTAPDQPVLDAPSEVPPEPSNPDETHSHNQSILKESQPKPIDLSKEITPKFSEPTKTALPKQTQKKEMALKVSEHTSKLSTKPTEVQKQMEQPTYADPSRQVEASKQTDQSKQSATELHKSNHPKPEAVAFPDVQFNTEQIEAIYRQSTESMLSVIDECRRIQGTLLIRAIAERYGLAVSINDEQPQPVLESGKQGKKRKYTNSNDNPSGKRFKKNTTKP